MPILSFWIERDDIEVEVDVEYSYSRARRGHRDRYGVPLEPDEPESVEIESVVDPEGKEIELTPSELASATERCLEVEGDRLFEKLGL